MKLLSLGLERYGRFTDRVLEFDPAARVVVVQGANEAGKTTALAAVTDVLFGIEERSRFNFLHEYKLMRLSATVEGVDGQRLSFARLKRRDKTLVDPETDTVLPGEGLAPFLGAYDRRAFEEIFGLNQARLREGGRKLLAGGGDLAETLLAVAPGLSQVASLRDRMKGNAAQIFNPDRRNASHAFYRAVDKRSQAQRRLRDEEVRVDEVKKVRDAADESARLREQAVTAEIDAALALQRAEALGRGARELRIIDAELALQAGMGEVLVVPAGFIRRTRSLLAAFDEARAVADRAVGEKRAAQAALDAIVLDDDILQLAEAVTGCDEERAAVQRELASLPKRSAEVLEAQAALKTLALGLGLDSHEALLALKPAPPLLARADKLVDGLRAWGALAGALAKDKAKMAELRRRVEDARSELGHVADPQAFKRRVAALDGAEERERAVKSLGLRLDAGRLELGDRLSRLGIGVPDLDVLARLPFPELAVAESAQRAAGSAAERVARHRQALADLHEQLAKAEARLALLLAGRPAPTEAAIAAARRERDDLWGSLRPLASGERRADASDREAARAFERAVSGADQLADERLTEAKRLADLARAELDIAELRAGCTAAESRIEDAVGEGETQRAEWRALWASVALEPAADDAALVLLREVGSIRQAYAALRREAADGEAIREAARADRVEIEQLRRDLGLAPLADEQPGIVSRCMAELRHAVAELEQRFLGARDHERDLQRLGETAADIAHRSEELARERQALEKETAVVFPLLAIRDEASVDEARAALDLWRRALTLAEALGTAEYRVAGIVRDRDAFIDRAVALAAQAGVAVDRDDAFAVAKSLRARLEAARLARTKADTAREALEARHRTTVAAEIALERAQSALDEQIALAGLADPEMLTAVLDTLEVAEVSTARLAEARTRLADIRGAPGEDEMRSAIGDRDDESLARVIAEAAAAHEAARGARDRAVERDTEARAAVEMLERRVGAAGAAQDEQDAVAEIADAMERFTHDYVAARLLTAAIERYRQRHQSPIVERASRAFAGLTGGRWSGVAVDYDEDPPRLGALRDGRLLGVDALSEGTADQLFLALRIAAIIDHAGRATPLPFLADDLFVTFDEGRTEAGFGLLGELGEITQVIVFTHHEHVAAAASRALGPAAAVIQL
ncbi:MAG: AAA family ATPase [Chelatococcus sp.]|uniref:ATP-binding protein n=1 Tax=Chelatococcus sp. TaxID=1953771 RepID=UPI0025C03F0E|nr:YhaN family protein [Chelatococcus sp.]MBX3539798.1 AAA family ATPase [Chelatococcus sp.]